MSRRRALLISGFLFLVITAARRVGAAETDVDTGAYGGSASGGWACGPSARANYGGVGAEVRVHTADAPDEGPVIAVAGAIEHRSYVRLDCKPGPCRDSLGEGATVPPPSTLGAASVKGGYDGKWVGFRLGALTWEHFSKADDRLPSLFVFPDCTLRIGPLESFRGEIGLGSYAMPTLLRPGAYLGVAYAPARRWEIAVHGGVHATFDDGSGFRGDASLRVPLTDDLQVGGGFALSSGTRELPEPEGRLLLGGSF